MHAAISITPKTEVGYIPKPTLRNISPMTVSPVRAHPPALGRSHSTARACGLGRVPRRIRNGDGRPGGQAQGRLSAGADISGFNEAQASRELLHPAPHLARALARP